MIVLKGIHSPKRRLAGDNSRASWFRYYAGFSTDFVEDIIARLDLPATATILDPWLGSGTTTEVAVSKDYKIKGYDLNPAMLLVAKARTLPTSGANRIPVLIESISQAFRRNIGNDMKLIYRNNEPLEQWLQPASSRIFRILERSVARIISQQEISSTNPMWSRSNKASAYLAFFYVGLFRTLRHFISEYRSSNPTWVKILSGKERVYASADRILNRLIKEIDDLLRAIRSETHIMPSISHNKCLIGRASSLYLPLSSGSVDAVISSPPYCTRIDYVRATLPELAVIDFPNGDSIRRLREKMIGTPTIGRIRIQRSFAWGRTCLRFLSAVENHPSKASSTYYLKYFLQYFAAIFASLHEIDRVLKKSGRCVLVVQDSYYKEILNDLPCVFIEMADGLGWKLMQKLDFHIKQTLSGVNRRVKQYRKIFQAKESVLVFSKQRADRSN